MSYIDDGRPLSTQGLLGVLLCRTQETLLEVVLTALESGGNAYRPRHLLATPFKRHSPSGQAPPGRGITAEIRAQISVMLREKLTPPPRETYSLNWFERPLACLRSRVHRLHPRAALRGAPSRT
ncbi:hypothetical protein C8F04DRAFT_1401303 [Mycena alexandri]|uniref:Uncharacterized protein n=1 Tax=Mycena alexandri TaxID=1745969 RepID=A0AAD6SBZ3_9AGAR|nr:hypothetical protein C8F04DRAFT_1401303 [Mycena alexandri]